MRRRIGLVILAAAIGLAAAAGQKAHGQFGPAPYDTNLSKWFYYPHHYYPWNYWPQMGPQWPERPGEPYMKPPAYMAYPPFKEPHWHYEWMRPQRYYRGSHFWLDQF